MDAIILLVAIFGALIAIAVYQKRWKTQQRANHIERLSALAARVDGKVHTDGGKMNPRLEFTAGQTPVRFGFEQRTKIVQTLLRGELTPRPDLRFVLSPTEKVLPFSRPIGLDRIRLGDAKFDELFFVVASDEVEIKRLLDRDLMDQLIEMGPQPPYQYIELKKGRLVVMANLVDDPVDLRLMMETGLAFIRRLQAPAG